MWERMIIPREEAEPTLSQETFILGPMGEQRMEPEVKGRVDASSKGGERERGTEESSPT